jgi:hypothetical protein
MVTIIEIYNVKPAAGLAALEDADDLGRVS